MAQLFLLAMRSSIVVFPMSQTSSCKFKLDPAPPKAQQR